MRNTPVKASPMQLVIVVEAIYGDVGLIAAGTIYCPAARIGGCIDLIAHIGHASLQAQEFDGIASFGGDFQNLFGIERIAQRRIDRVDGRSLALNVNGGGGRADVENEIQRCGGIDLQHHALFAAGSESGCAN